MGKFKKYSDSKFAKTMEELKNNYKVQQMQKFKHHRVTTTFNHCCNVSECSYRIARRLHLKIDEESLARGAMLHDFYLYNFKEQLDVKGYEHGTKHPIWALANASQYFNLNAVEADIIISHMWPLTFTHIPHCKEAILVCVADKVCAIKEGVFGRAYNC